MSSAILWLSAASLAGCGRHVPALFADRPVVAAVRDDHAIDLPSRRAFDEREQISDIYLRRPLFDVIHPTEFPTAGDVNAMDEVPTSTWYDAEQKILTDPDSSPPTLPLTAVDEKPLIVEDALVVKDARGSRYELLSDPPEKSGLFTGAEVLGGYVLRGLGLRAPRSWIQSVSATGIIAENEKANARLTAWLAKHAAPGQEGRRVSATLWPNGIDLGNTGDFFVRRDDPNDRVAHHDRRTLRAMKVFAQWIGWSRFNVRSTRDVYVGKPGEGHLVHYFVGTSRAFGTLDLQPEDERDEESGSIGWNLITLGLSPPTVRKARRSPFSSMGYLPPFLVPGDFDVSPPYSPFARLTPPDEYWAGKRLMDAPEDARKAGIAAAFLQPEAGRHLSDVLEHRRRLLVAHAMSVVTPIDIAAGVGRAVWLRDRAINAGVAEVADTSYDISFLGYDGAQLAPRIRLRARGELTAVPLPKDLVGTVVLHVYSIRGGVESPRPCDIHVKADVATVRAIGIRH